MTSPVVPLVELIDSSEFHGSPDKEWNFKIFKLKKLIFNKTLIKVLLYISLWFIGGRIALQYQLHGIYAITSGFLIIFFNLGTRQDGTQSAYSVFNKGFYTLLGTFTESDVSNMFHRNPHNNNRNDNQPLTEDKDFQAEGQKSEFEGLSDDQMMGKVNKLGNKRCFCDSGRKYKKCHYYLQLRAKQEYDDEEKRSKLEKKKQQ